MKKLFLIAVATVFLASCQSDEDITPENSIVGNWELVEARNSWPVSVIPASELPFSDAYEFRVNGTFSKFNTHFGHELTGTYEHKIITSENNPNGITVFNLTFTSENMDSVMPSHEDGRERNFNRNPSYFIIYGQNRRESLMINDEGNLSNSGYGIEDGPVYIYAK